MDRYKQARDNHRQKPRPTGVAARCWYSFVSTMFYCIWNNTAVDDHEHDDTVIRAPSRQASQAAITTNDDHQDLHDNSNHQTRQSNPNIPQPVANGNVLTPRDLYAKKASCKATASQVSVGNKTVSGAILHGPDEPKVLPEDVMSKSNRSVNSTKKQAKKTKKAKKRRCTKAVSPVEKSTSKSSFLGEASAKDSAPNKKEKTSNKTRPFKGVSNLEDQHTAVFYEPDRRRKGGAVIQDYYEFLIRLLHTGSKTVTATNTMTQGSCHVTTGESHTTSMSQNRRDCSPPYTNVQTTSLADLHDDCQTLAGVEEVEKTWTLPRYYTEYTDIVPIEVQLGLRPPRSCT